MIDETEKKAQKLPNEQINKIELLTKRSYGGNKDQIKQNSRVSHPQI